MKNISPLNLSLVVPSVKDRGEIGILPLQNLAQMAMQLCDEIDRWSDDAILSSVTFKGNDPLHEDAWPYMENIIGTIREKSPEAEISIVTNARNLSALCGELVALRPLNIIVRMDGNFGDPSSGLSHIGDTYMGRKNSIQFASNNMFDYLSYANHLASAPFIETKGIDFVELQQYLQNSLSVHSIFYGKNNPVSKELKTTNFERLKDLVQSLSDYAFAAWHPAFEIAQSPIGDIRPDKKNLPIEEMEQLLILANKLQVPTYFNDSLNLFQDIIKYMPYVYDISATEQNHTPITLLPSGYIQLGHKDRIPFAPGKSIVDTIGMENFPAAGAKSDTYLLQAEYNTRKARAAKKIATPGRKENPLFPTRGHFVTL